MTLLKCRTSLPFFFASCCHYNPDKTAATLQDSCQESDESERRLIQPPFVSGCDGIRRINLRRFHLSPAAISPSSLSAPSLCYTLLFVSAKQIPSSPPAAFHFRSPLAGNVTPSSLVFCLSSFHFSISLAVFPTASTIFHPPERSLLFSSHRIAFFLWLFFSQFFVSSSPFFLSPPFILPLTCHYPPSPTALCPSYLPPSGASTWGTHKRLTAWHCATEASRSCAGNITGPF